MRQILSPPRTKVIDDLTKLFVCPVVDTCVVLSEERDGSLAVFEAT